MSSQGSVVGTMKKLEKENGIPAHQLCGQHQTGRPDNILEQGHQSERFRQTRGICQQEHQVFQQVQMQSCISTSQRLNNRGTVLPRRDCVLTHSPLHMNQQGNLTEVKTISILGYINRSVAGILIHFYLTVFRWHLGCFNQLWAH